MTEIEKQKLIEFLREHIKIDLHTDITKTMSTGPSTTSYLGSSVITIPSQDLYIEVILRFDDEYIVGTNSRVKL